MKLATKTLLTFTTAALIGSSADAAVVVDSFVDIGANASNVTPYTVTGSNLGSFTVGTSDKLIVALAGRQVSDTSVTYGGALLEVGAAEFSLGNNDGSGFVFYLDDPISDGDLVITGAHNSMHISLYAVSGLADGGPVQVASDTSDSGDVPAGVDISLTTGSAGGFVVASVGASGTSATPTVTGGTVSTNFGRGGNAAWIDGGSTTYNFTTPVDRNAGVMVEFAAVPEPGSGSLALLGLGGLLITRRRRG